MNRKNAMVLTIFYTIHWFETPSALSLHISSPYINVIEIITAHTWFRWGAPLIPIIFVSHLHSRWVSVMKERANNVRWTAASMLWRHHIHSSASNSFIYFVILLNQFAFFFFWWWSTCSIVLNAGWMWMVTICIWTAKVFLLIHNYSIMATKRDKLIIFCQTLFGRYVLNTDTSI